MKIVLYIITLIVVAFGLQMFLPWWSMPLVAAILAILFGLSPLKGFMAGFLGAALLHKTVFDRVASSRHHRRLCEHPSSSWRTF